MHKRQFFLSFFLALIVGPVFAAYLNRPELVDFNFANANICEKVSLRIKFDYENFNPGNVFTVEISAPGGSFSAPTTLIGSLIASGSQQNVYLTVQFPTSVLAGNSYRLRVKGSSPLTYSSQLNEYPFTISKIQPTDLNYFPVGFWRGYFFTWTPSTTGVINNGNNEDIFNPANFVGYIAEDTLAFDFNWGNNTNAPGNLPDTVKVCGQYRDNFSLRMKRKIYFEDGFYIFGGGADDGFRLSTDGGTTWLINDWSDHSYRGSVYNNGCGIPMTAGWRDVIVDFYEHDIDARFRCIIKKTGDPAVNPISIISPANGATICANAPLIPLVGNPPGAYQWGGPGVSASGWLNPAVGGTGPRTITYQTGFAAFGQNCVKTSSITVNVVPGLSAQFSGLDSVYCSGVSMAYTLSPQNPGGSFTGPGVSGNIFDPSQAGAGFHWISYILNTPGGCNDTVRKMVHVYAPQPVSISGLPSSICAGNGPLTLVGTPAGGVFSGQGVTGNVFNPCLVVPNNSYAIQYQIVQGCNNSTTQNIFVAQKPDATLSLPQANFCIGNLSKVKISALPLGGVLTGPAIVGDSLDPGMLVSGPYSLQYIVQNGSCSDTAYFSFSVNPIPDAGFADMPDTVCVGSPNIILQPNVPGGQFIGQGVIPPNQFSPSILLADNTYRIEYRIVQNGCSNISEQYIRILSKAKIPVQVLEMKSKFCTADPIFSLKSEPMGQFYLNGNQITAINPAQIGPGNYLLKAVFIPDTPLSCIDSSSAVFPFTIIANPRPDLGPDKEIDSGQELVLNPNITGTWTWTSTDSTISLPPNQIVKILPTENVTITVLAVDPSGTCQGNDALEVRVNPNLFFPNLFTPNGDSYNEGWIIKGAVSPLNVTIFDRWGKEIYSGISDGELAWNGKGAQKSGLYYYLVENPRTGSQWNGWLMVEGKQ